MTKATLTERLWAYNHLWWWITGTVLPLLLLLTFAVPELVLRMMGRPFEQPMEREERRAATLTFAVILALNSVAVYVIILVLLRWCGRWSARKFGVLCPFCGGALTGKYKYVVFGTGKCGRCQTQVVEDAPASLIEGIALPTRTELQTRLEGYKATYLRKGNLWILAFWLCPLSSALMTWPFAVYESFLRSGRLFWLASAVCIGVFGAPWLVYLHYLTRWSSQLRQSHGLVCPWCEAPLTLAKWKIAPTGRCDACGQPVWADAA